MDATNKRRGPVLESYEHRKAIEVLTGWLRYDFKVVQEVDFDGFRPDITVYENEKIKAVYEVVHKHELTGQKLNKMQMFAYFHNIHFPVYEVEAEWILSKCSKPKKIKSITFAI